MFDVDGTLVMSDDFEGNCYLAAVYEVLGHGLDTDWAKYTYVSAEGILYQHISENGLYANRNSIQGAVKEAYTNNIASHIKNNPVQQVPGAAQFINMLRQLKNMSLSIATGGWKETTLMKLESAEIDVSDIPIASSNDHFSRNEIMKLAIEKSIGQTQVPCTYFGDGEWDKKACEELGFNFVLVGERISHDQKIMDFNEPHKAMAFIDL
jgi:FMN phosphatase YigB (HAD superfamily)